MLEEKIEPADRIRAHAAAVGGDAHFVHRFDALLAQSTPMRVPLDEIGEMLLEDVQFWRRRKAGGTPVSRHFCERTAQTHDARGRAIGAASSRVVADYEEAVKDGAMIGVGDGARIARDVSQQLLAGTAGEKALATPARLHVRALEQTMSRRVVHFLEQLVDSAFEEVKQRPEEIVEIEAQQRLTAVG